MHLIDDRPSASDLAQEEWLDNPVDPTLDEDDFPLSPEDEEMAPPDYALLDLDTQHADRMRLLLKRWVWGVAA